MLPDFLKSSWKIYKDDTDSVANWLAETADQCGYSSDLLSRTEPSSSPTPKPSARLKGKARKQARDAATAQDKQSKSANVADDSPAKASYIIKVREFTTLAEYIVGSGKPVIKVPSSLVNTLNRVIELRSQQNFKFRKQKDSDTLTEKTNADESHSYFVGILERTREILKPLMPPDMVDGVLGEPLSGMSINKNPAEKTTNKTRNTFESLDIQEPSQEFLDAPDITPAPVSRSNAEHRYKAETIHSLEEQYLAVHCLFQDLLYIRAFLRELWISYHKGDLDLVAASLTTNTAIDFIRDMEQEYLQQFPERSDYESIVKMFYVVQCRIRGDDPTHKQHPDDPFNFAAYDLAEKCLLSTYVVLGSVQNVIDPGSLPIYKPGRFGHRDLRSNWSQKSPREKFKDDQLILLEAFPDLMVMTLITSKSPLAEDELIRGFRDMRPGKDIPLWLVFAAQCFLDIQHVLNQDIGRAHKQLLSTANSIRTSVKENMEFHKSLRIDNWPRSNDFQFTEMIRVTEEWALRDMIAEKLRELQGNLPIPVPEPFRLLKQYPLLCGLFIFALKMRAQEICLAFANAWGSILYVSQLYNAARQENFLQQPWKDMELLIALHSTEVFFAGDRPKVLEEYLKRFMLSIGYSVANFASNRRRGGALAMSARGPRILTQLCKAGELFMGRYCNNDRAVAWTRESFQQIVESKMHNDRDEGESNPKVTTAEKKPNKVKTATTGTLMRKTKTHKHVITTLDFLEDLAHTLHSETLELSIDYLRIHRFCWEMLRRVNEQCRPKLLEMYGGGYLETENQLPFIVGYVFMTATQTSRVANLLLPKRQGGEVSSRLLATAAGAMEAMIDDGAGEMEMRALARTYGFRVDLSAIDDDFS